MRSIAAPDQRSSIRRLRPSFHPRSARAWRRAAKRDCSRGSLYSDAINTPMRRTCSLCSARAASGHAAAAPPSSVMKSRRPMSNMAASSPQSVDRAVSLPPSRRWVTRTALNRSESRQDKWRFARTNATMGAREGAERLRQGAQTRSAWCRTHRTQRQSPFRVRRPARAQTER